MMSKSYYIDKIKELKAKGLRQFEIGRELNVSQTYVSKLSKQAGIKWEMGAVTRDQTGDKNPFYKGGTARSTIERLTRRVVRSSGRNLRLCERCGFESTTKELHRHHKDRNRSNNTESNLEVLCTICHNQEHEKDRVRDCNGRYLA